MSTPFKGRRSPKSAGQILRSTLDAYHLSHKTQEYAAFPYWEEIVGKEIAQVAVPEKIVRGKVLVIRVIDSVWAQELSMQKQALLDKIFAFGKGAVLEDLKFITGDPKSMRSQKKSV